MFDRDRWWLWLLFILFYLVCFAYILNKRTELENSVHTELNNTIIEYCFKEQCGCRFTASMYNTIEQLNKILTSCNQLLLTYWLWLCGIARFNACDSMRVSCLMCDADIDKCKLFKPCHKHAECHNIMGGYWCECKKGYYGDGKFCRKITLSKVLFLQIFSAHNCLLTSGCHGDITPRYLPKGVSPG